MSSKKFLSLLIVLALALSFVLTACSNGDPGQTEAEPPDSSVAALTGDGAAPSEEQGMSTDDMLIYYIGKNAASNFWRMVNEGAVQAGEEHGVKVVSLNPNSEQEVQGQITMVEEAVNAGAHAIVLGPLDTQALIQACVEARAAGVKVIIIDSLIQSDDYEVAYRTDNKAAAETMAEMMAEELGGKGNIWLLSSMPGSEVDQILQNSFIAYMNANYPDIKIINQDNIVYCQNDILTGTTLTLDAIAANSATLDGIYCTTGNATKGAAQAVLESKRTDLVLYGSGLYDTTLHLLEDAVDKAFLQQARLVGYTGCDAAIRILKGEQIEKGIDTLDVVVVDKDNMYTDEVQNLLFEPVPPLN
ncbi:MAG: substrate-binding domain-containing protein [Christensenellales bacterium]|jgi:ribose transport system substrate-binding protein